MKKNLLKPFLILITVFAFQNVFSQTTVTISLAQGNGEDAGLAAGTPTINFGNYGSFGGYTWSCTGNLCVSRGLAKFDLSSIPAGATITNASLQLFADLNWGTAPTTGGPNNGGYLSRVTSTWTENVVTWNTQPTTTAANQVTIPASSSTTQNYTLNVTSLVQDMVNNTNYGFMIKMQDELNYYKSLMFASSDNANTAKTPILTITYNMTAATTASISLCQGNGEDAYLASGTPSTNFGTHGSLGGNTWTCSGNVCNSRGLFKFDLSSIPSGATILNSSMQLFGDLNWSASPTTGGPNNSGYLSRVTSSWTENAVTWNTQPTTTTTNMVTIPGSTSTTQNYTLNVTSLVQDMINNTNYGFMLKMLDEVNYYKSLMFASSDNANSAKCPILTISYQTTNGISELSNQVETSMYPNPFTDEIKITCSKTFKKLVVYDTMGKVCFEENVNDDICVIKNTLVQGVYFVKIYGDGNKLFVTKKIVKL